MKICVLAVLLPLGCSSKDSAPKAAPVPAERPSATDPIGFCARASMLVMGRQKCFPEDTSLKMALDEISDLDSSAPTPPDARRAVAAKCAVMLDSMMRVHQPKNCPLDVTDDERRELVTFLTAWYGERTPAPKTDNRDLDATLGKVVAQRDAACACKTSNCARDAITALTTALGALPAESKAANEAAAKMSDEATRCKQMLTYGAPAPAP
jgi:hypothetical protein